MMIRPTARTLVVATVLLAAALAAPDAVAGPAPLWRLGEFDHSSAEFNQGTPDSPFPQGPITYVIGTNSPSRDWPAFQPGSLNETAGRKPHPYTIQFRLPDSPKGLYTLKIGLLINDGDRLSVMQIEINGRLGWAFPRVQWHKPYDNELGQRRWMAGVDVELPTSALRQGDNSLVLTAIGGNPGLTYDALELDQDPGQSFIPDKLAVRPEPTIFYKQKDGRLLELVEVYVDYNSPLQKGVAGLAVGATELSGELAPGHDFGEERLEFAVPAFDSATKAVVSLSPGGHPQQFPVVLEPAKRWKLLVVPHEHLDVGYTNLQARIAELQSRTLDEAMQLIHDHPDFRFSTDAYWVVQQYLAGRDTVGQQELLRLMKDRKVFSPAEHTNLLTEFPGVETLIRSFYDSFDFDRKNGLDFDYANLTDVPSPAWSYASIMAAAGLKYFLVGSDPIRGPIVLLGDLEERSPFWWEGPDGGRILMWYAHSYAQILGAFGSPPTVEGGRNSLPGFLAPYTSPNYRSDTVLLYGTQPENSDLHSEQANIVESWNKAYAYPRLSYSDFSTALRVITNGQENSLPVIRGDGGPYWEDGIYSDAYTTILARENEQRAPSAEKISTISSLVHPHVSPDAAAVRQLWQNILLTDEHTWGDALSICTPGRMVESRQLAAKEAFATQAEQELEAVMDRGMLAIEDRIDVPAGTCVVFNPLNWRRSGWVEWDLEKGSELVDPVSGQSVPYEVVSELRNFIPREPLFPIPLFRHIRFTAQDVPALGYKCYAMRPERSKPVPFSTIAGTVMENAYYRVVLDGESGAVSSIFDKEVRAELVNPSSPYRFDQYLYVTGGDQPFDNRLLFFDPDLPIPTLGVHTAHGGRLRSIERTPFGAIAHLESTDTNTPRIETDVILFDSEKKIEFVDHVRKDTVNTKEAVYFAFPFAMDGPVFRYDGQNGVIDPTHDLLPGAAREWFSLQHWISVRQGAISVALVPVDANLFTLGDIVRGKWPTELGPHGGAVFSYAMNNYWFTNYIAAQGGDFTFRYVMTSGRDLEPGQLSRWGWDEMTPLEASATTEIVKSAGGSILPQPLNTAEASFLKVNESNIILVNWKMAEDGRGTILRFLEVAGKAGTVEVEIPIMKLDGAWMCNAMEENQGPLATTLHGLSFDVKPFQIITVRVAGSPSS